MVQYSYFTGQIIHLQCDYVLKLFNCRDTSQLLLLAALFDSKGAPCHGPWDCGKQITSGSAMDTAVTVDQILC